MRKKAMVRKIAIDLPVDLLKDIEEIEPDGGVGGFLCRAAQSYISQARFLKAIEAGYGAWKVDNHPDLATVEDTAAFMRRLRESNENWPIEVEQPNAS